jgi:hypothetical protein
MAVLDEYRNARFRGVRPAQRGWKASQQAVRSALAVATHSPAPRGRTSAATQGRRSSSHRCHRRQTATQWPALLGTACWATGTKGAWPPTRPVPVACGDPASARPTVGLTAGALDPHAHHRFPREGGRSCGSVIG